MTMMTSHFKGGKEPSSIPQDIYEYLEGYNKVSPESVKKLSDDLAETITKKLEEYREPSISMSSMGKPLRRLWYDLKYPTKPDGQARLKFLYGDIIECLLLWLVEQSGHSVKDRQRSVEYNGIRGSIDAIIDGHLSDEKSCSDRAFSKFSENTLPTNDAFGYLPQISGYYEALKKEGEDLKGVFFLAMNKSTGAITTYSPDMLFDLPNAKEVSDNAKKVAKQSEPPEALCYQPVPHGKSGNMQLDLGCRYCPHKYRCFPDLKEYQYASGKVYLTQVVKEPRVELANTKEK